MMDTARKTATGCRLVLASSSPRRRELLAGAGVEFEVVPPPIDEPTGDCRRVGPVQQAEALAFFKAAAVHELHRDAWVLAADTIVALDGVILGKPDDEAGARGMLRTLSGTRHAVITGVALLSPGGTRRLAAAQTYVTMQAMSDAEIDEYIAGGEWVGKAGSYAIQESADRFVESVEGSFTNVVGLPMELVTRLLDKKARSVDGAEPFGEMPPWPQDID